MVGHHPGDRCPDRYELSLAHQDLVHGGRLEHLDLDVGLLGLDDHDDLAPLDVIAGRDEPLDDAPLVHVRAEGRHGERGRRRRRHDATASAVPSIAAIAASTIRSTLGNAACSSWWAYGSGTSAVQTRPTGASSS